MAVPSAHALTVPASQQSVFKPAAPVLKSDAPANGDKERHIGSPLSREIAAFGHSVGAEGVVTYDRNGRLASAGHPGVLHSQGNSIAIDKKAAGQKGVEAPTEKEGESGFSGEKASGEKDSSGSIAQDDNATSEQEQEKQLEIRALAARDREVRAHEQAHAAIGGAFAGAPKYQFERGPDGVNYAVGGEVPIDVSPAATPEATISKMQAVRRAALAPAEPSPQDRRVAQEAIAAEASARQEIMRAEKSAENGGLADDSVRIEGEQDAPAQSDADSDFEADRVAPTVAMERAADKTDYQLSSRGQAGRPATPFSVIA